MRINTLSIVYTSNLSFAPFLTRRVPGLLTELPLFLFPNLNPQPLHPPHDAPFSIIRIPMRYSLLLLLLLLRGPRSHQLPQIARRDLRARDVLRAIRAPGPGCVLLRGEDLLVVGLVGGGYPRGRGGVIEW